MLDFIARLDGVVADGAMAAVVLRCETHNGILPFGPGSGRKRLGQSRRPGDCRLSSEATVTDLPPKHVVRSSSKTASVHDFVISSGVTVARGMHAKAERRPLLATTVRQRLTFVPPT